MADTDEALADFLLGTPRASGLAGPHGAGLVSGSPGILKRIIEWYPGDPTGPSQTLTLAAAAVGILAPPSAASATITTEVAPIRVTFDGAAASATRGLLLPAGTVMQLTGRDTLNGASFFTTAPGGLVQVQFWT